MLPFFLSSSSQTMVKLSFASLVKRIPVHRKLLPGENHLSPQLRQILHWHNHLPIPPHSVTFQTTKIHVQRLQSHFLTAVSYLYLSKRIARRKLCGIVLKGFRSFIVDYASLQTAHLKVLLCFRFLPGRGMFSVHC